MNKEQLAAVLEQHKKWLAGKGGQRANLSGANLYRANLSRANLSGADLYRANLSGANLSGANLSGVNLSWANLSGADLYRADLSWANLSRADLSGADLSGANLSRANLSGANLYRANLSRANLSGADLYRANLSGANLSGANLSGVKNCDLILARAEILPREGEVIGWKKCEDDVLVKLRVPPESKRSNALGRKCRAEYVEVLEVVGSKVGVSLHDDETKYKTGETVKCHEWNSDRLVECGGGILFYLTREEAEAHT
jgi:hypothetical protein